MGIKLRTSRLQRVKTKTTRGVYSVNEIWSMENRLTSTANFHICAILALAATSSIAMLTTRLISHRRVFSLIADHAPEW
jgi:hypothetical protein